MKNQAIDILSDVKCLCGSNSYTVLRRGVCSRQITDYQFSLYKCETCNLVRVFPLPDVSLYTKGYSASTSSGSRKYIPREKPWCSYLAKEIEEVLCVYPELQGKPVLDVGCNGGELVEQLNRLNIQSEGCDIDPVAIDYGNKKGLSLFIQDLSIQPLDRQYGVVIMNHTLEHIIPAIDVIKNILNALIPGGILQIHVPNYGGWIPQIMGDNWGFLVPHEHVWQFTPETLKFHVESSSSGHVNAVKISCSTNLEPIGIGMKGIIKASLISVSTKLNKGDEIIATFQKIVSY